MLFWNSFINTSKYKSLTLLVHPHRRRPVPVDTWSWGTPPHAPESRRMFRHLCPLPCTLPTVCIHEYLEGSFGHRAPGRTPLQFNRKMAKSSGPWQSGYQQLPLKITHGRIAQVFPAPMWSSGSRWQSPDPEGLAHSRFETRIPARMCN